MKIAIVGSGVSGLVAAHLLDPAHDVTVFEAGSHVGGHTHTHELEVEGQRYVVDTGFIVFNHWTYPNFIRLLDRLGVRSQPTVMSFGVRDDQVGLEYSTESLGSLFAQKKNLLSARHWAMLRDFVRFGREARQLLSEPAWELTLRELLERGGYGRDFVERLIVPMGSAIWSAPLGGMHEFPAQLFVEFFHNHGMLNLLHRPIWRTVQGGSFTYVKAIERGLARAVRLNTPIERVLRHGDHVEVTPRGAATERFDQIILACHSDQALKLLADASDAEREVLGAIRYQPNEAVLHTDASVLPKRRDAWAAWNYHLPESGDAGRATLTYDMNRLQRIDAPCTFCVTLNSSESIDPQKIIRRLQYAHPQFDLAAVRAQGQYGRIASMQQRTHFAGAYWFNGFHEDGVRSGLRVVEAFGIKPWVAKAPTEAIRRAA